MIRIPARFNGPAASGHGGYSAGAIAGALGARGPVAVSLRAPVPLETDLEVRRDGDGITVHHAETLIGSATPAAELATPPLVLSPAEAAAATLDPEKLAEWHPFPTCFGCGPQRAPGGGLRLFAGPLAERPGEYAADWTPSPELADEEGRVPDVQVWAALDCPGGSAASDRPERGDDFTPIVLGRFSVSIDAAVRAGDRYAIVSRDAGRDGRKRATAFALFDEHGEMCAHGDSLWIAIR